MNSRPLILDFDASVAGIDGADILSLHERQEEVRFACRMRTLRALGEELAPALYSNPSVVFMGSGDYHHISYLLIERMRNPGSVLQVVVFDNHPDNMRYPFGIHCGSWVAHVSRLPFVSCVHVLGITSMDVQGAHVWENHLGPLRSGKVRYWCAGRDLRALGMLGIDRSRSFATVREMIEHFAVEAAGWTEPVYLSIDKDVLSPQVVATNWDQGVMTMEELESAIVLIKPLVIAADVTGEVSSYHFRTRFKRILSALDRQPPVPPASLVLWQKQHQAVNRRLLSLLADAGENFR